MRRRRDYRRRLGIGLEYGDHDYNGGDLGGHPEGGLGLGRPKGNEKKIEK